MQFQMHVGDHATFLATNVLLSNPNTVSVSGTEGTYGPKVLTALQVGTVEVMGLAANGTVLHVTVIA